MMTIYKYRFKIEDSFTIEMPRSAQLLHVAVQRGVPCVWAFVVTTEPMVKRKFRLAGTGHPVENGLYVGSFFQLDGDLVWHLFDQNEEQL